MNFKCALVGMAGVGKTSLIRRYVTGEYCGTSISGINAQTIVLHTTGGVLHLECFDCEGVSEIEADAYIGVMEQNSKPSVEWLQNSQREFLATCVNKCEKKTTDYTWKSVFPDSVLVSAKCNYNFEQLLLSVAKKLLNEPHLELIEPPAIMPPDAEL
jgi:hypothetical protein